jgi:FG-GAP repeat
MRRFLIALSIVAVVLSTAPAGAAGGSETKLTPSDAAGHDQFGAAVAVSGDTIVVGAPLVGAAYVYSPDGLGGHDEVKLTPSDAPAGEDFGRSVAVSGGAIVVGDPFDDAAGLQSGAAYVFLADGSGGYDRVKLAASDGAPSDWFGRSVAVSGDTIVVGAPRDDEAGFQSGSVYVFTPNGLGGYEETKLTAPDAESGDNFGEAAAVWGDTIVVGSPNDDDDGDSSGSVYVFAASRSGVYQATKLAASDGAAGDQFGSSVAISARRIVVGAFGDDGAGDQSGSAYVFTAVRSSTYRESKLTAFDGAAFDAFGWSVAVAGRTVVVGAPFDDDAADWSGSAYVYRLDRSGGGYDSAKLVASDAAHGDEFGWSVATSGPRIVVGAPVNDLAEPLHSGAAYLFTS